MTRFRIVWPVGLVLVLAFGVFGCSDPAAGGADGATTADSGPEDAAGLDGATVDSGGKDGLSTQDLSGAMDAGVDTHYEPDPGETGWPCTSNDMCDSGFCLDLSDEAEGYCSDLCQQYCPPGYLCKNQPQYGPVVFLCVAIEEVGCIKQCSHPGTFKDCGVPGALCTNVDGVGYCLEACDSDADCPFDFSCTSFEDDDGFVLGTQCAPLSGSCVCGSDTDYLSDPQHCGACENTCDFPNAAALCEAGGCVMGDCAPGFSDLNEDPADGCEMDCEYLGPDDLPDPDYIDANCDGIDGVLSQAVFVSATGNDTGNDEGTMDEPFASINAGISFAASKTPTGVVLVAAGTYFEQVQISQGVSVAGGYKPSDWSRNPGLNPTVIFAKNVGAAGAIRAVIAEQITVPTTLSGFTIRTMNNPTPSGPVMAVWIRDCSADLRFEENTLEPGNGGAGQSGISGAPGPDGADGFPGETGGPDNWWNPSAEILGGTGGTHTCSGGDDASAGGGGKAGWGDNPTFDDEVPATAGKSGAGGASGGGAGGTKSNGGNGSAGAAGPLGLDGNGGGAMGTIEASGFWFASHGDDGAKGSNGTGGGGGGGGGGGYEGGFGGEHTHGGGGSGGGSGGCGGSTGSGGGGGGGSFSFYLSGGAATLASNKIHFGTGGNGGGAGEGGKGGKKGTGGQPGQGSGSAGEGGWGGIGGKGGRGGHGGGGGGGPSVAIFAIHDAQPHCPSNSFIGKAKPGSGGSSQGLVGATGLGNKVGPVNIGTCLVKGI